MANNLENVWLINLQRQAGIRRALLIHGDIFDVRFCSETQEYVPVTDLVLRVLRRSGFNQVIAWDRFGGAEGSSRTAWGELSREATMGPSKRKPGSSDYDVGPTETSVSNVGAGNAPSSVEDFLSVVHYHLHNPTRQRYAFVIDWSQYLFGNANALSEQERQWLLILSRAVRNSPLPFNDHDSLSEPANAVVLICNKIGTIPPAFYQNNPTAQEILIPPPGRVEREAFIQRSIDKWNLRMCPRPGELAFSDLVDSTEGMSLRDLQQVVKLSRQVPGDPLTFEQLISLYKFGEQKSPWEDLSRAKLRTINDQLAKRVKGQSQSIEKVSTVIIRAYAGLSGLQHSKKQKMPKGVLFFVGPTGVGKTELAKALAQFLFGDEDACIRFDMSEFNHEHSDQRLVGAPPGYVGFEEGGQLTNAVKKRPFSVLLFDEIEKAHVRILDKFLQILEDGRLTDGKGETVHFSETVIIFTSNIGASEVKCDPDADSVKAKFIEKVREHFVSTAKRPELLNRIGDNIVPFNFITGDDFLVAIARAKLQPLRDRLKEKYRIAELRFSDEEKALKALAGCVDRQMGGRGVLNEMVKRLIDPLAAFLFEEEEDPSYYAGRNVVVHQAGEQANYVFTLE